MVMEMNDSNISEELDGGHPGDEEEGEGVVVQQTQQLHYCEIPTLSQELIEIIIIII